MSGHDAAPSGERTLAAVCVYCGSSPGRDPVHARAATALGRELARRRIRLIYGGGEVGLMGTVADAVIAGGGQVTGVIPTGLFSREVAHRGITELVEVATMHERKMGMFERSDAFIALPGGLGTLEELAEVMTWAQIGVHDKPIGILDVADYWAPLMAWFDQAVAAGFMKDQHLELLVRGTRPADLLHALAVHRAPRVEKWLDPDEI